MSERIELPGGWHLSKYGPDKMAMWDSDNKLFTVWPFDMGQKLGAAMNTRPAPERHNELREALEKIMSMDAGLAFLLMAIKAQDKQSELELRVRDLRKECQAVEAALAEQATPVKNEG